MHFYVCILRKVNFAMHYRSSICAATGLICVTTVDYQRYTVEGYSLLRRHTYACVYN